MNFNSANYDVWINVFGSLLVLTVAIALIVVIADVVGAKFSHFVDALKREIADLADRKWTVGSVDVVAIIVVAVLGAILIVVDEFRDLVGIVKRTIGVPQADALAHSIELANLFYSIVFVAVASLVCTTAVEWRKRSRRR